MHSRQNDEKRMIAIVQMDCIPADIMHNCSLHLKFIKEILQQVPDTNLIVFPELSLYGYAEFEKIFDHKICQQIKNAEGEIAAAAKKYGIDIIVGSLSKILTDEKHRQNYTNIYKNDLVWINCKGNIHSRYSKNHLTSADKKIFSSGNEFKSFECVWGKSGLLICWDIIYPETARTYRDRGVKLLIVAAAWEKPYQRQWETAILARAMENRMWIIAVNRIGRDDNFEFFGKSIIADPLGRIISQAKENESGYLIFDTGMMKEKLICEETAAFGNPFADLQKYD